MKLVYATDKVENLCESLKAAKKFFNGNIMLANSLMARINKNGRDLEGYFAIDVKSRREQWRIILEPLDENKEPYIPCKIDQIAESVRIVEITEVSKHYE